MPFCHLSWRSATLGKEVAMHVLLPSIGEPPYPVYYLLHGLSDDYTTWLRRTRIEWYVRELPLIVVLPDGFRGFYTNHAAGPAYGDYLGVELPAFVERHFQARTDRGGRCIGGLSMGGYGALRTALEWPDRYVSSNSHSGALLAHGSYLANQERHRIFGDTPEGTAHDLVHLARQAKAGEQRPDLLIDCGTDDFIYQESVRYHQELDAMGYEHLYREFPGAHNWDYWDEHVQEALRFHAEKLGIA